LLGLLYPFARLFGQVFLVEGTGTFAQTTSGGNGVNIPPGTCTPAAGGTFTASNYTISYTANSGTLTVVAPANSNSDYFRSII
jgi:hypothetical protein